MGDKSVKRKLEILNQSEYDAYTLTALLHTPSINNQSILYHTIPNRYAKKTKPLYRPSSKMKKKYPKRLTCTNCKKKRQYTTNNTSLREPPSLIQQKNPYTAFLLCLVLNFMSK
jgi:hypothetical protein